MDWVGVVMIGTVLIVGTVGGLLHRRLDGRIRDISAARRRLSELTDGVPAVRRWRRPPNDAASSAAAAASNAAAAAAAPAPVNRSAKPALHVVRDGETVVRPDEGNQRGEHDSGGQAHAVVPDEREEPGVVAPAAGPAGGGDRLSPELLARLGVQPAPATLLQFSSAFCAPCRTVRRVSAEVISLLPEVQHVEVDAESHLDEVRELGIWRTPTMLLLDADGRVVKRATGVPSKAQLIAALAEVLPEAQ